MKKAIFICLALVVFCMLSQTSKPSSTDPNEDIPEIKSDEADHDTKHQFEWKSKDVTVQQDDAGSDENADQEQVRIVDKTYCTVCGETFTGENQYEEAKAHSLESHGEMCIRKERSYSSSEITQTEEDDEQNETDATDDLTMPIK